MRTFFLFGSALLLLCVGETASAECGFLDIHCIAEDAGKNAAIEVAKGLDVATLNARDLTNQFGGLVADLYGGDPKRQARARAIFTGLLGRDLAEGEVPHFQVSILLVGAPQETLDVDTYVFSKDNNDAVKNLFSNDKSAFNAHRLNASSVEPLTDEAVRKRVFAAAYQYEQNIEPPEYYLNCAGHPEVLSVYPDVKSQPAPNVSYMNGTPPPGPAAFPCWRAIRAYRLGSMILTLQGTPEAQPTISRHTDDAPGGVVAILAPQDQLEVLARRKPSATIQVWVHDKDRPESPTLRFRSADGKVRVPAEISTAEMLTADKCFPTTRHYGAICFIWVPLRLESIVALPEKTP